MTPEFKRNNDTTESPLRQSAVEVTLGERRRELIMRFQRDVQRGDDEEFRDSVELGALIGYEPLRKIEAEIEAVESLMDELLEGMDSQDERVSIRAAARMAEAGDKLQDLTRRKIKILQLPLSAVFPGRKRAA